MFRSEIVRESLAHLPYVKNCIVSPGFILDLSWAQAELTLFDQFQAFPWKTHTFPSLLEFFRILYQHVEVFVFVFYVLQIKWYFLSIAYDYKIIIVQKYFCEQVLEASKISL